jgi:hypothetical protein
MNAHAHASPTQAADLADYLLPYSEEMQQARRYDIGGLLARSARKRELRDQYSDLPPDLDEAKG